MKIDISGVTYEVTKRYVCQSANKDAIESDCIDMSGATDCKVSPVWSTTPPTEPGWYWWRGILPDRAGTFMVQVEGPSNHLDMAFNQFLTRTRIYGIDAGRNSEWCGPLTPSEP
jgi:hypothetical protein